LTSQLYRPGADPSSTRSTSSAVARTAIPITHYRILSKQQPAATPRLVAKRKPALTSAECWIVAKGIARMAPHLRSLLGHRDTAGSIVPVSLRGL
jgi:hypothetical protein